MHIGTQSFSYDYTPSDYTNQYSEWSGSMEEPVGEYRGAAYRTPVTSTLTSLSGDFIDNYVQGTDISVNNWNGYYGGGAVFLSQLNGETITAVNGNFIGNYVQSVNETFAYYDNYAGYGGGLFIYNRESDIPYSSSVIDVSANFIGNYVLTQNLDARGGGLAVTGSAGYVLGDFIGNYAEVTAGSLPQFPRALGGALYVDTVGEPGSGVASIHGVSGNFYDNYVSSMGDMGRGGAIYIGKAYISSIYNSNFSGNYAENYFAQNSATGGGAIYVDTEGYLGSITNTDFEGNYSGYYGGAILNKGQIDSISGSTFLENYVSKQNGYDKQQGGAIYNEGKILSLTGIFDGNYSGYYGGAIANNAGKIGEIKNSTFDSNSVSELYNVAAAVDSALGGAIANLNGGIVVIKNSSFNQNEAYAIQHSASGAAISNGGYNVDGGEVTVIDSSFTGNVTTSASLTGIGGGAIHNSNRLNLIAQNADVTFSGNTFNGENVDLFNSGDFEELETNHDSVVNLNAAEGREIVFNGTIKGDYSWTVSGQTYYSVLNINKSGLAYETLDNVGESTYVDITEKDGTIVLNNNVSGNVINLYNGTLKLGENGVLTVGTAFNVYGGTLDLSGDGIHNKSFYNATFSTALGYALDVNADNNSADELTIYNAGTSVGVINVTDIHFNRALIVGDEGEALVLVDATDNNLTLTVADNVAHQETSTPISGVDGIASDMNWQDKVGAWTAESVDVIDITAVASATVADSLHWAMTNEIRNKTYSENSDTLAELNKYDTDDDKNFNFDSSGDVYTVVDNLGETSGKLNVNGVDDGQGNKSTIDMDGYQGFDIAADSNVTLNDVNLVNNGDEKSVTEVDEGGVLNVNDSNISENIEIANNGEMNLNGDNNIKAEISGNGSIHVNGGETTFEDTTVENDIELAEDSTLKLAGDNTLKGDVNGDGLIDNQGNTTLSDATVGVGVRVNNDGTINFVGNSAINGPITGNGASNISGYVTATNDISGTINVLNGGTLDVVNNTIHVDNITFGKGSTLALTVNSENDHGVLIADQISVAKGAVLSATLGQGIVGVSEEKTLQLIRANNTDFNNFTDTFDNNMYRFEKADQNGAYKISLVKSGEDVSKDAGGSKTNQGAAAAWIDGNKFADGSIEAAMADELAALAQNDAKSLNEALTSLAPADAPVVQENVVALTNRLYSHVNQHLLNDRLGKRRGKSSGDELEDVSVWGDAYIGKSKLDNRGQFYGFDTDSRGLVLGVDKKLTSDVKLGAGYQYDDTDIDGHKRKTDVDTNTVFGYAEYKPSAWYVNGLMSYGRSKYREKKNVLGNTYKGSYHADAYGLQSSTGYEIVTEYANLTPQAGLRYNHIKRHGYVDGVGQHISGKNMDVLTAVGGVRIAKDMYGFKCKYIRPEAYLGVTYDLMSNRDDSVVKLSNGSSYAVHGKRLARLGIETGVGLTAELTNNLSTNINYIGAFREDYQDHTGLIGLKYNF